LEIFDKLDVPAAAYNKIDDLLDDPHLNDIGFFEEIEHPTQGRILKTKTPTTFTGGMREDTLHAPLIGEQTREVLADVGFGKDEIDQLLNTGAAIEP
jgi:crotonobetainyl-CoA:carnitine CoA-transferase CaiB-like acyl-CoA transferase